MTRTEHFFVLYRANRPDEPWPIDDIRRTVSALNLHPGAAWHLLPVGPLLVGWLGAERDVREPFLLHAGDLAEPSPETASRPDFARGLVHDPPPADFPLDGSFAACAVDPAAGKAVLCTDHFGTFPLFHYEHEGTRCYATSLRLLAALMKPRCRLDRAAVYEMLGFHMILGDRTFLREIELVPFGTVLRLHGAEPEATRYWDWHRLEHGAEHEVSPTRDYVHETYAKIEKAIMRSVRGAKNVAVWLSGGLDSRLLAAVLARNEVPFRAYNIDFGRETPIASRVAETLGVPLTVLPMLPEPSRAMFEGHDAIDCLYDVNQTWGWDMAERAAREGCDLFLDGLAFDAILGAVLRVGGNDPAGLAAGLKGSYQEIDPVTLGRVTGAPAAAAIQESLDASILTTARTCLDAAGERASEYFVMNNRVRKFTFGYGLAHLRHLPGAFPYVTRDLFEHCMRLPLSERLEHSLYRRIYRELFPALAQIPWAKTNLPLDQYAAPPEQARWRQLLQAAVRRLSLGRLGVPGQKTFGDAFRRRPELRAPFLRRLRDPGVVNLHGGVPNDTIANVLWWQNAGRDYGSLLQALFTVENFLTRFVKEGDVTLVE